MENEEEQQAGPSVVAAVVETQTKGKGKGKEVKKKREPAKKKETKKKAPTTPKSKKGKARAFVVDSSEGEMEDEEMEDGEAIVRSPRPTRSARARGGDVKGKGKALPDPAEEEDEPMVERDPLEPPPIGDFVVPDDEEESEYEEERRVVASPSKKRKAPTKRKPRKSTEATTGSESESGGGVRKKTKTTTRKRKALKTVREEGEGEDDEEDSDPAPVKAKRTRKVGQRAKQSKVDIEVFGRHGGDEENDQLVQDEAEYFDSDGEPRVVKPRKKRTISMGPDGLPRTRNRKEPIRTTVDPTTTTMADIATSRDLIDGRTSERGRELMKREFEGKAKRRAKIAKMKRHSDRRKLGVKSDTEEDEIAAEIARVERAGEEGGGSPARFDGLDGGGGVPRRVGSPDLLGRIAAAAAGQGLQEGAEGSQAGDAEMEDEDEWEEGDEFDEDGNKKKKKKRGGGEGEDGDDEEDEEDYTGLQETQYAPQMRIVDGQLVLDDASLEVDRAFDVRRSLFPSVNASFSLTLPVCSSQSLLGHVGPREVIEESAKDRMINSSTWGKMRRTEKWSQQETDRFYDVR